MHRIVYFPAVAGPHLTDPWGLEGWVDLVGWWHTEMVYPPENDHPSKHSPGPTSLNLVDQTNVVNRYATPPIHQAKMIENLSLYSKSPEKSSVNVENDLNFLAKLAKLHQYKLWQFHVLWRSTSELYYKLFSLEYRSGHSHCITLNPITTLSSITWLLDVTGYRSQTLVDWWSVWRGLLMHADPQRCQDSIALNSSFDKWLK